MSALIAFFIGVVTASAGWCAFAVYYGAKQDQKARTERRERFMEVRQRKGN